MESLSTITDNSVTSSTFKYKVSALKSFGLIEQRDDAVSLSTIGYGIAAPTSPAEEAEARATAFLEVPKYRSFHSRYAGKLLPDMDRLPNILHRELDIEKDYAEQWADSLEEDLEAANLLSRRGSQRMVLSEPESEGPAHSPRVPSSAAPPTEQPRQPAASAPVPSMPASEGQRIQVKLSEGHGMIIVPETVTGADIEKLKTILDALSPEEG